MNDRAPPPPRAEGRAARVLVVDADADLARLLEQWLQAEGLQVHTATLPAAGAQLAPDAALEVALVIADLPFPTRPRVEALRAQLGPAGPAPLLVLSTTVFASVDCCGPAARSLGADGLLPQPTTGDALRRAVRSLIVP